MRTIHSPLQMQELVKEKPYWGWVKGMYLGGNDCGIALRLHKGYDYEPFSRGLWKKLSRGNMVVDVGAHTGIYSLDAWRAGASEVLSIEPYFLNYSRLLMNLRYNDFPTQYTISYAAGSWNGIGTLNIQAPMHYCSSGGQLEYGPSPKRQGVGRFPVIVKKLDEMIDESFHKDIRVVKIDTERHGVEVLKGMTDILSYKPDLILECIEDGLTEILKPLGYKFFRINEEKGLERVESLAPDNPVDMESPNRFATVGDSYG